MPIYITQDSLFVSGDSWPLNKFIERKTPTETIIRFYNDNPQYQTAGLMEWLRAKRERERRERIRLERERRIEENTVTYDYSPFCVVQTDHETFISIRALEHEDNVYNTGIRYFPYSLGLWQEWRAHLEYLRPSKIGALTIWKNDNPIHFDCAQLLGATK